MTEQELREMVRESIARHMGTTRSTSDAGHEHGAPRGSHPSFALFALQSADGPSDCLIEPAVRCTHCGFCKTYGH